MYKSFKRAIWQRNEHNLTWWSYNTAIVNFLINPVTLKENNM